MQYSHLLDAGPAIFSNWLYDIQPDWRWNWPHLAKIRNRLNRMQSGEIQKLMLFLPPRHGKSEMTTVRYPAWLLERNPDMRIIVGAYNQTLANKFSRKIRKIAMSRDVPIDPARRASEEWETMTGGGLRAAGVGAGITGMGANLIIIDDPVKNREEANSLTYRDKVWSWYTDDLYTRLEPGGQVILIMTRWHEDDLAGRILQSEDADNWHVLSLPAIAEHGDELGRQIGAALCPERYDLDALANIKTAIGGRAFASLYQQRPVEQEGEAFKRSWFKFINHDDIPNDTRFIWYWDKAATPGSGDYTAGVKMGKSRDGRVIIADVKNGQWGTNERDNLCMNLMEQEGRGVPFYFELEGGSSGKDVMTYQSRMFAGFPVKFQSPTGSKEVRAMPFAAQLEAGNVYLVRGAWNGRYIDELCSFPQGAHDDMVDASSGAFNNIFGAGARLTNQPASTSKWKTGAPASTSGSRWRT